MRIFNFIIVTTLCLSEILSAQIPSQLIFWEEKDKLLWSDFQGNVPRNKDYFFAEAECGLAVELIDFNYYSGKAKMCVKATFNPKKSWSRAKSGSSAQLAHEQIHFDIAQIFARELFLKYSETTFSRNNFNTKMQEIYDSYYNEYRRTQEAYDRETRHGLNKNAQEIWESKVKARIIKYDHINSCPTDL